MVKNDQWDSHYICTGLLSFRDLFCGKHEPREAYNGKELDRHFDLDLYNYGARFYDPLIGRFTTPDPLSEKYYLVSPYAYCANNPVNRIDPDGRDWYTDRDGTYQYDPNIKAQEDLKKGQTYVGATHQVKDKRGNVTENYRSDGSIMFSGESSGYKRIWNNTQKTGNEELGIIMENGVLVLPSWDNDSHSAKLNVYGYLWDNGKLVDAVDGKKKSILGTVHTHPTLEMHEGKVIHSWMGPSGSDFRYSGENTPGTPFFVITADMKIHSNIAINKQEWFPVSLPEVNGISPTFNGIVYRKYPLINVLKSNKK